MKKTIIFIICSGRTGSTLLSKFLGTNSNAFALSEPHYFDTQHTLGELCSCEKNYFECEFWTKVRKELGLTESNVSEFYTSKYPFATGNYINKAIRYISLWLYSRFSIPFIDKQYSSQIRNEIKVLKSVIKLRNEQVIIDASKSLVRAIFIEHELKDHFQFKYIYLKRDPRSVITSWKKNSVTIETAKGPIIKKGNNSNFDIVERVRHYQLVQRNINLLFNIFSKKKINIVYEDFVANPKAVYQYLGDYIGMEWENKMLKLDSFEHHLLGGNYSRINAKSIHQPKIEWSQLTEEELIYIKDTLNLK